MKYQIGLLVAALLITDDLFTNALVIPRDTKNERTVKLYKRALENEKQDSGSTSQNSDADFESSKFCAPSHPQLAVLLKSGMIEEYNNHVQEQLYLLREYLDEQKTELLGNVSPPLRHQRSKDEFTRTKELLRELHDENQKIYAEEVEKIIQESLESLIANLEDSGDPEALSLKNDLLLTLDMMQKSPNNPKNYTERFNSLLERYKDVVNLDTPMGDSGIDGYGIAELFQQDIARDVEGYQENGKSITDQNGASAFPTDIAPYKVPLAYDFEG